VKNFVVLKEIINFVAEKTICGAKIIVSREI